MTPDSGLWKGARYHFTFVIPPLYPHEPPKVTCHTKIYHPNINLQGNVCLNILREDWKPVLDINAVIYGLIYLFYEPNPDDPLNREAAELFRNDNAQVFLYIELLYLFDDIYYICVVVSKNCQENSARTITRWGIISTTCLILRISNMFGNIFLCLLFDIHIYYKYCICVAVVF